MDEELKRAIAASIEVQKQEEQGIVSSIISYSRFFRNISRTRIRTSLSPWKTLFNRTKVDTEEM